LRIDAQVVLVVEAENSKGQNNLPSLGGANKPTRSGAEPRLGGEAALPYLVGALGGEETHERWRAAQALGQIGGRAITELVEALGDPRDNVRKAASTALYAIGEAGLAPLIDSLPEADPPTRREIVRLVGMIGAQAPDEEPRAAVLSALAGALAEPDAVVRAQAVEGLGWLGDPAAVPDLLDALADGEETVRLKAASALVLIGGGQAAEGLRQAASEGDPEVRRLAAWTLEAVERGEAANLTDPDELSIH
jgi:HEAT repeat protein